MTPLALHMVSAPLSLLPDVQAETFSGPLSQVLRARTESAHKEVEIRLALPGSILTLSDYVDYLLRFHQLYRPMEVQFQHFSDWSDFGLDPPGCSFSGWLAADLQALNVSFSDALDAPSASVPPMRNFASALGVRYVLEGSTLGAQFMLPALQNTLGDRIVGADRFFRGRGLETGAFWRTFRTALDLYGDTHPEQIANVVSSAVVTFGAIGLWVRP